LLAEHYALADIFIMPNRTLANGDTEGFGLVFMEASACGVPVIGGRAGGTAEAVRDGVTGLLVDGTSRDDISAAIRQLLDNPAQRAAMGRAGVAFAAENGWRSRAARFLAACTPDRG
jgi:phosphatidylinositol alpha-1,6-mannosyltransferase